MVRKQLARRGMFCVNTYSYEHRGKTVSVVIFYRYLQRSRLNRWLARALRHRQAALSPIVSRYRVLRKLDAYNDRALVNRKRSLKTFPERLTQLPKRKFVKRDV